MNDELNPNGAGGAAANDYETATARLDEIIARLDSGDAQLRETLDLCAEAKTLIEYCATELAAVDEGLKELRLEDLAASLKPDSTPAQPVEAESAPPGPERVETTGDDSTPPGDEQPPPPEEPPF
jgi:exodeoxyribonuclease VII small subunit